MLHYELHDHLRTGSRHLSPLPSSSYHPLSRHVTVARPGPDEYYCRQSYLPHLCIPLHWQQLKNLFRPQRKWGNVNIDPVRSCRVEFDCKNSLSKTPILQFRTTLTQDLSTVALFRAMAINSCHATSDSSNRNTKETASGQFKSIPILSLERARNPDTKPAFLTELRDALLKVGFLYLADTGLPPNLIQQIKDETIKFFDESILPLTEKERIEMKNEKSFLGWSRVSNISTRRVLGTLLFYDSTRGVSSISFS